MARAIDESKLNRIHAATLQLVVEHGYGGASIVSIARRAGVAEGYLYRFYPSKHELVVSLLFNKVNQLISKLKELLENDTVTRSIIEQLILGIFELAEIEKNDILFIHSLMHHYHFQISTSQREEIRLLCEQVIALGGRNGELEASLTPEEVYTMCFLYPIEFIHLRIKGFLGKTDWSAEEKQRVITFCINSLKPV
ncbi:MAG: TetR/AcrR family transcriptional regulator [Marinilabiliales bacterium]|nr:TetR/AcrR family transcriptional regulator [Marinilabiliales bacterium]